MDPWRHHLHPTKGRGPPWVCCPPPCPSSCPLRNWHEGEEPKKNSNSGPCLQDMDASTQRRALSTSRDASSWADRAENGCLPSRGVCEEQLRARVGLPGWESVQSNSEGRAEVEGGGCAVRSGRGDEKDGSDMLCHLGQVGPWPRGASERGDVIPLWVSGPSVL